MPRAICRCGEPLNVPDDGTDRVVCPKCRARVRIRRNREESPDDGFIRFFCPCGRRLKVAAERPPAQGKCPECGRIVPVPPRSTGARPPGHPEADTVDLGPEARAVLSHWAQRHGVGGPDPGSGDDPDPTPPIAEMPRPLPTPDRAEAGLRVCPKCHKPVHLGADACRLCGTSVPRR